MSEPKPAPVLALRGISKAFPGVRALEGVDVEIRAGEVHALVGENGAGKSTLIKIASGVLRPDSGTMELEGSPYAPASPRAAQAAGVVAIHQEVDLVPHLSLAENLFLGRHPRRRWLGIDWKGMARRARAALAPLGVEVDVRRKAAEVPVAVQQLVAIARALELEARCLVLDEPTSSLGRAERERLFALMRELRGRGLGLVFIAHGLDQVYAVADRITVLRNGRKAGTFDAEHLPPLELVGHMLGRTAGEVRALEVARAARRRPRTEPFVRARGLGRAGAIEPFDLDLAGGEVVGLAGLLGSGRSELARLLFGADAPTAGELAVDGAPRRLRSPRDAVGLGFAFTPEDRARDGVVPHLSVRENIALVAQRRMSRTGLLSRGAQRRLAERWIERLRIAAADPEQPLGTLSGGNQQKVLLARWLAAEPRLFLLDEPTRGIDVGAKVEIERLVASLADRGMAVVFISSALEEVARESDRVVVLRERRVAGELPGEEADESALVRAIAGEGAPGGGGGGAGG